MNLLFSWFLDCNSLSDPAFRLSYDKAPGCCNGWRISRYERPKTMTNESFFGLGFVWTVAENFGITIFAIISFFAMAIKLSFTFSFCELIVECFAFLSRRLIVESHWDCIAFGRPVKFWFRKCRRKPPDKLCNPSPSRLRDPSSSRFRLL